jgi:hypothetical protein
MLTANFRNRDDGGRDIITVQHFYTRLQNTDVARDVTVNRRFQSSAATGRDILLALEPHWILFDGQVETRHFTSTRINVQVYIVPSLILNFNFRTSRLAREKTLHVLNHFRWVWPTYEPTREVVPGSAQCFLNPEMFGRRPSAAATTKPYLYRWPLEHN